MKYYLSVHKNYIWHSISLYVSIVAILSLFFKDTFTYTEAVFFVLPLMIIFYMISILFYKRTYLIVNTDSFDIYYMGVFKIRISKNRILGVESISNARGILALNQRQTMLTLKDKKIAIALNDNDAFENAIEKMLETKS